MGFMDEEVLTVGSAAYNLAGDVKSRGNFTKNTILNLVISGASKSGLGRGMVNAHINGPATTYKRFAKWAEKSGYNNQVGNYTGLSYTANSLSQTGFDYLVATRAGFQKRAVSFSVETINIYLIATAYIFKNRPERRGTVYTVEQEMEIKYTFGPFPVYMPTGNLIIKYADNTQEIYTPPYVLTTISLYGYLYYEERPSGDPEITDTGWITATPPDRTGFIGTPIITSETVTGTKTIRTQIDYSDATPDTDSTTSSTISGVFNKEEGSYTKTSTVAATPTVVGKETVIVQDEESLYTVGFDAVVEVTTETLVGDVTKTTTKTTSSPTIETYWKYRRVTTITRDEKWEPIQIAIYQKGSSVTGDAAVFTAPVSVGKFFPVIPVRRFNQMIVDSTFPVQYEWNRKAARKAFGSKKKYDEIIESLETSESVNDIDHAWVVFGVSLGTQQRDGQAYLFEFFKNLADSTPVSVYAYRNANEFSADWVNFALALQLSSNDENQAAARPVPPVAQQYNFSVTATNGLQNWEYNVNIAGKGGDKTTGFGFNTRSQNKVGQCWVYHKGAVTIGVPTFISQSSDMSDTGGYYDFTLSTTQVVVFGSQITDDLWEEYEFFDLVHTNNVYGGKTVVTLAYKAIVDKDENSTFIIPLHEGVFEETGLIRRTQLSLECAFLVLNYYDIQEIPWYATGLFQILLVVAVIVITVYSGGIGGGTAGLLGTNAAVGATLGFAGTAAIVAGAVANAIAAAIVAAVITKASTMIFGDTWGKIIGAIVSIVVINLYTPGAKAFSISDMWTQMTKADNLMKLSLSGLQEYGNYMQGKAQNIMMETQKMQAEYETASNEISKMMNELMSGSGVDPQMISEAIRYATESPEQFFTRTTMTGTEIAEVSIKLVEDFPGPQQKLPYLED